MIITSATPRTDALVAAFKPENPAAFRIDLLIDHAHDLEDELAKAHRTMAAFYTDMENALGERRVAANPVVYDIKVLVAESSTHLQTIGRLREALDRIEQTPPQGFLTGHMAFDHLRDIAKEALGPSQSPSLRIQLTETIAMYEGKAYDEESILNVRGLDSACYTNAQIRAGTFRSMAQHLKTLL